MIVHVLVADCRQHWHTARGPDDPPIVMIERPAAYVKPPEQTTDPGRVGDWYVPVHGVRLEDTAWHPENWSLTKHDKYVRVPLHRYFIPQTDPRQLSAACLQIGFTAAAQLLTAKLQITDVYIVQGDVTTSDAKLANYLGLAFCVRS